MEKATEFVKRMKKVQKEVEVVSRKMEEEMKRQPDRERMEVEDWKKDDKVMLSMRNLVFKKRPAKNLTERYVKLYEIEEVILKNMVKLKLLTSIRIYTVVNISRIMRYIEQVKGQRVEEPKPVEVDRVEEQEVEKILNKRKVRRVMKYLMCWKGFMAENNIQEKKEDLENTKKLVDKFKGRINIEIKQQEKLGKKERVKLNLKTEKVRRNKLLQT